MKKKFYRIVGIAMLTLTLAACSPSAVIDWVDFVQFGGIQYLATDFAGGIVGRSLTDGDLGPEFDRVRFKVAGNVHNAGYRPQDGDAAFLDAGTPVYTVKGYRPEFRLAARRDGRLLLFEADTNPKAKTGADLLDVGGKVRYIGLNSREDGVTELAAITDPQQVTTLVELVLRAPVEQNWQDQGGGQGGYFLAFHLADGTVVTRAYSLDSGELSRGIMLPQEFRTAVEQTLVAARPATRSVPGSVGLPAPAVSLATDPHDRRAAYALLITNELYRTTDRGQSWQRLPLPAAVKPYELPLDPENPNRIPLLPQHEIVVTSAAPGHIFVRAEEILYRSDDRGLTWYSIQDNVIAWTVEDINGSFLYAWRAADLSRKEWGLYYSEDRGQSWSQVYSGFFPQFFKSEDFSPNHEGITSLIAGIYLYAGTDFGLFRSLDGGRSWQEVNTGLPPSQRLYRWSPILIGGYADTYALSEVSTDGQSGQAILAHLRYGHVSPEEDSWTVIGNEALVPYASSEAAGFYGIHTLVLDRIPGWRLYLGTEQGLLISEDGGESWQPVDLAGVGAVFRVAAAPGEQTQLYLWTDRGLVTTTLPAATSPTPVSPEVSLELVERIGGTSSTVAVVGDMAYLGVGPRLVALDMSDPGRPEAMGQSAVLEGVNEQTAPTTPARTDLARARAALLTYFSLLNDRRYGEAVTYYGGSYDLLRDWNPTADSEDYVTLFERGCKLLQCLEVETIISEEEVSPLEFKFVVEFMNEDGSLFVRGPCCGATKTEMPPQSQFPYTVRKVGDRFLVQELPIYVP